MALIEDSIEHELRTKLLNDNNCNRAQKLKNILKKIEVILNEKQSGIPQKKG